MKRAVFLDKDGTLIPDIPYNTDPNLITLSENSVEGLKRLQHEGYVLVVISNQSGVARGYFKEEALAEVKSRIEFLFEKQGIYLDDFFYCPHHAEGNTEGYKMDCNCRKPKPGMIQEAAEKLNIDLSESWMIGDILNDVEAGNRAGCKTVLIDNGNETEWIKGEFRTPSFIAKNINEAENYILKPIKEKTADEYSLS